MKEIDLSGRGQQQRANAEVEVKVLSSLRHPYIVRYWESFNHDRHLCIVMDLCEGGDLWQYISQCKKKHHQIQEPQVVRWFTQLLLALKYMHEKNVLHRDIKTQNIFLARRERESNTLGCVKIADFGISKILGEGSDAFARTLVGTPYYLSPEMCQKQPYACPSDVWALGCVLYEMCALRVPFEAQELPQLVERIVRGPLPRLPNSYSPHLSDLVSEMLIRDAFQRPAAAALLHRQLVQNEIKRLLADNKRECGADENGRRHTGASRPSDTCSNRPSEAGRNGDGDGARGSRRPLIEVNVREPNRPRASSKPSSRVPSPAKGAALEVLRSSRAPSPRRQM